MISSQQLIGILMIVVVLAASSCSQNEAGATPFPTQVVPPASTSTPLPTPTALIPSPTATAAPTMEITPTPSALAVPAFVDSTDCQGDSISKEFLPTVEAQIEVDGTSFSVIAEVADSPEERGQGLMCRSILRDSEGMLFIFNEAVSRGFWMYNTYVPLEILYITEENNIAGYAKMTPCPRNEAESDSEWRVRCLMESQNYRPDGPYRTSLELPQGWLERVTGTLDPSKVSVTFNRDGTGGG